MGAQKIFIICLFIFVFFNVIFYMAKLNTFMLSASSIIGIFITLGGIAVILSIIPTTNAAPALKWFMSIILVVSIFYSITIPGGLMGPTITIGIGIATNIISMFSSDTNSFSFLPWIFFTILSLLGVVCGMLSISSYGSD